MPTEADTLPDTVVLTAAELAEVRAGLADWYERTANEERDQEQTEPTMPVARIRADAARVTR